MHHGIDTVRGQCAIDQSRKGVDAECKQIGQRRADHAEGQPEHEEHHAEKDRDRGIFAGQHPVDRHTAAVFPALMRFDHRCGDDPFNEGIPHIGKRGVAIQSALVLHLDDTVLKKLPFVVIQLQTVGDFRIPLYELAGTEARRQSRSLGMVVDEMYDGVDAAVDSGIGGTEVPHLRLLPVLRGRNGFVDQLRHTVSTGRADGNDRDAKHIAHFRDVDRAAVRVDLIHHIECQHHRYAQLQKLQGQVEIALDVGRVHDIDDAVRLLVEDEIACNDLLLRIRTERINAGQIDDLAILHIADIADLLIHGDARKIADVLVGAGQHVEQGGFATVLIACECKNHIATS